jgi:cytochrome c biogenesis protein CcmG/thiol:disulfide interchange protein DsbE
MTISKRPPSLAAAQAAMLSVLMLMGLGCSSKSNTSGASEPAAKTDQASASPSGDPGGGQVLHLDFSLPKALGDGDMDLKKLDGTIRVVDFWATWCPPCRLAIPGLNELYRKYKDQGVSVVGISVDENAKALAGFDKEIHIEYASLLSSEKAEKTFGGIVGLPTTFVLDRNGKVYKSYVGEVEKPELEADIQALLAVR